MMSTAAAEHQALARSQLARWRAWLFAFAATVVAVPVCVAYLDRPIALLAEEWFGGVPVVGAFTRTPGFFGPLVIVVVAIFLVRRFTSRGLGRADTVILLSAASLLAADALKRQLKFVFGRTWPKYEHPSFLRDGVYGFNPFHHGHVFESFPSGHMTATCALIVVLWIYYPRFRPLYAACIAGLAGALVVGNYHFLGDVIAGGFLGTSVGLLVVSLWELYGGHDRASAYR